MKQNGVVCWPGPALLFFIFRFEYPLDSAIGFTNIYPLESDLFGG